MQFAYTMAGRNGALDRALYDLSQVLISRGWRTAGVVQINTDREDCRGCDMDVLILPDVQKIRISQSLGKEARGCRLDADALETAVGHAAQQLQEGADILLINKFGKMEADGRGFRDVIASAIAADIPVIVGLNAMNKPAFQAFTDGLAVEVPSDPDALLAWVEATRADVAKAV